MEKHLFFDLDRTLWDFERNSKAALRQVFDESGLHLKIKNFYDFLNTYKRINHELWLDYARGKVDKAVLRTERFGRTLQEFKIADAELAGHMDREYVRISPMQKQLFPGTIETLEELQRNEYRMHIITNGFREVQHIKLKNCGLSAFFDVIVCSEEVGRNKPDPAIFHHSLQKAGAKLECSVMIGDDLTTDIGGSSKIGMKNVLFDPEEQFRNYTGDYRIRKLDELPALLPWVFRSN